MPRIAGLHTNIAAFLDMVAHSEMGPDILRQSDDGYNVLMGSMPGMVITFSSYHRHPGILIDADGKSGGLESNAAGRYQFLGRYWPAYRDQLKLPDFGPQSQDKWAIQLLKECKAIELIEAGKFNAAVDACRSRWASLPGAGYGQHENKIDALQTAYMKAGGVVWRTTGSA